MRRDGAVAWIVALLALLPPALMAHMGSLSRLFADDYCHIAWSEQFGMLDALLRVRNAWNGSYSNYFVQFLFASNGEAAPAVFPPLIIVIWLIGLTWLTLIALKQLRVERRRLPLALTVAGLLVVAAINGFHSDQSFFWLSANVAYALPVALLVLIIAVGIHLALRPSLRISAVLCLVAAGCLFNAGFSPMYLVFQAAALSALMLGAMLFLHETFRRRCLILLGAGWLSTAAAALVLVTAPGFSGRLASEKYAELNQGPPVRELPELLLRSLETMFEQVGYQPAFAGFALMLSLSLFVTLSLYRPQRALDPFRPPALAKRPLWAGFIAQLLFLPILWAHTSDATQFLGRFSAAFFLVICLNIAQISAFALLIASRKRIDKLLRGNESIWRVYITAIILAAALLFAMDQARSIHYKAATYLFSSAFALLCLLLWQLADRVSDADSRLWRQLPLFAAGATLFCYLALIILSLFSLGFLSERILAGTAFLHVASGLPWGLGLGLLLLRSGLISDVDDAAGRQYRLGAALVTIILAIGILNGQSRQLPALTAFASEWDTRHEEIIRQRDSGRDAIVVPELSYNLGERVDGFHIFDDTYNACATLYYGLESITRPGDG